MDTADTKNAIMALGKDQWREFVEIAQALPELPGNPEINSRLSEAIQELDASGPAWDTSVDMDEKEADDAENAYDIAWTSLRQALMQRLDLEDPQEKA